MKRLGSVLKFVPALLLLGLPLYTITFLEERQPRGIFERVARGFTTGLWWFFCYCLLAAAVAGVVWGLIQLIRLIRRAEREGWLGKLLAGPITFAMLASWWGYSARKWSWVAVLTWGVFFFAGLAVGFLLKKRAA
jgi:hypothetical protein